MWLVSHGRLGDTMSVEKFHRRRRVCLEIGGEGEESFRLTAAEWRFGHGVPASIGPMCIQRQMFLLGVKVPIWPWPMAAGGKGESGGRTRKTKYKYSHCSPSIASQMEATRFLFIWFVPVGDRWGRASKRNVP